MIEKYQELLNKCIDKHEDLERLKRTKSTSQKLKSNLIELKGGKEMGRHIKNEEYVANLENLVKLRDREITEIKSECADQFKKIKDLCHSNTYGNIHAQLRKIEEIADDNFMALLKDMFVENDEEGKIIELPTTRKSSK